MLFRFYSKKRHRQTWTSLNPPCLIFLSSNKDSKKERKRNNFSSKKEWINSSWIYKKREACIIRINRNQTIKTRRNSTSNSTNKGQISENENAFSQNTIWDAIDNFTYSPGEDIIFTSYFRRFENLYATDCVNWTDSKKVRLLLCTTEHTRFVNNILPRKTSELTFTDAVKLLTELF